MKVCKWLELKLLAFCIWERNKQNQVSSVVTASVLCVVWLLVTVAYFILRS